MCVDFFLLNEIADEVCFYEIENDLEMIRSKKNTHITRKSKKHVNIGFEREMVKLNEAQTHTHTHTRIHGENRENTHTIWKIMNGLYAENISLILARRERRERESEKLTLDRYREHTIY